MWVDWVLCTRSHQATVEVLAGAVVLSEAWVFFQALLGSWYNSAPVGRTETPCSQLAMWPLPASDFLSLALGQIYGTLVALSGPLSWSLC